MEALSQKKKIGIIAAAILILTVAVGVSTGHMSLSGLSSSAITSSNYICNEQNQARNLAQYNQIPNNIINANNKISIISGEIKVLQDKINAHNTTIAQKQVQIGTRPAEITRLNGLISPLTTFINTQCKNPTGNMVKTCNNKKKEKLKYENEITKLNNLENDITKLQNEIGTPENSKSLKGKIQLKENQIDIWQGKIAGYELSKKQYERCALELKTKPTVFSGAMSGEIKLISGEIQPGTEKLVSGEVMFFTGTVTAPLVSGEVTISGEVGQSTLLTVVTNKMEFSVKPSPENNFDIKNWFLEFDQYARTVCTSKQVSPSPVEIKVICNLPAKNTPPVVISAGTVSNFKLIGKLGSITMPLAVETNFVSLQYNGSRTDIDNQTASTKLRYEKPLVIDGYFRNASWTCHNGETRSEGGPTSCKPQSLWNQYAETFCQNKCSPETGKCGIKSYSNSEQCIDNSPSVCGNGIKEGAEQCDDGNTINGDGCDSFCKNEAGISCVDSDGGRKEDIKGVTTGLSVHPDEGYTSKEDYCIQKKADGTFNLNASLRDPYSAGQVSECTSNCAVMENYCSSTNVIVADVINCPNGCGNGACKPADPVVEMCEDLAITPSTIQGGGIVNYTCQANNDILCVLDPAFCKSKTYSIVIKKPDGAVLQTYTTATGSITIPSSPSGLYTAECFVNGQTTTIDACKKTINVSTQTCGNNSIQESTEQCDDGNTTNGDGCSSLCKYEEFSGNIIHGYIQNNGNLNQYFAVGNSGLNDATKLTLNFRSSYGNTEPATINKLIFRTYGESILGQKVETISQLRINNTIVPVVNGKAIFYGLNIPIPPNEQPVNIDVYISYFGINAATQKSPLTAQIEMEGYVYTTATRVGTKGSANIRFNNGNNLTASKPIIIASKPQNVLSIGQTGLIDVALAAHPAGDITMKTLSFGIQSYNSSLKNGIGSLVVRNADTGEVIPTTNTDFSGYPHVTTVTFTHPIMVSAGTVKRVRIYGDITNIIPGQSASVSTKLATDVNFGPSWQGFSWIDHAGGESILNDILELHNGNPFISVVSK